MSSLKRIYPQEQVVEAQIERKPGRQPVGRGIWESTVYPVDVTVRGVRLALLEKVFDTGEPLSISGSKMIVGDNLSWLTVALSPIKNSKGDVISVIGVSHDLTSEVEAENKIKKENSTH